MLRMGFRNIEMRMRPNRPQVAVCAPVYESHRPLTFQVRQSGGNSERSLLPTLRPPIFFTGSSPVYGLPSFRFALGWKILKAPPVSFILHSETSDSEGFDISPQTLPQSILRAAFPASRGF